MNVDLRYSDRIQNINFIHLCAPAIHEWLKVNKIQCEVTPISPNGWFASDGLPEGYRYTFKKAEDAVYFAFRWIQDEIDPADEFIEKYLNRLRDGVNQSVVDQQLII